MFAIILTVFISWFITTLFGYGVHYSLHQKWSGWLNHAHMTHHLKLYPANDYLSEKYRYAGLHSTPKFFFYIAIPTLFLPSFILWYNDILTIAQCIIVILTMITTGLIKNFIHDAFHIKDHWMTKNRFTKNWFEKRNNLHFIHHMGKMNYNYGITTFFWDKIFNSFQNKL